MPSQKTTKVTAAAEAATRRRVAQPQKSVN